MKKIIKIFVISLALSILLTGCVNNKNSKESKNSNWNINTEKSPVIFNEEEKNAFDKAVKDYQEEKLEAIALLGEQIVSGKNYMFLCRSKKENKQALKVVTIYKDLKGNAKVTEVKDFLIDKYADKDISFNSENLSGGWYTTIPGKPIMLEEDIQNALDDALEEVLGVSYYPIYLLGTEKKDNNKHAILSYGRVTSAQESTGVFVLTLETNNNKNNISSIAYIDLKELN